MSNARLALISGLLVGVAQATLTPVFSAQCSINCAPVSPPYCGKDSETRPCGPLRDSSHVETTGVEPNLESAIPASPADPFQISVDGVPLQDSQQATAADQQRQQDVAASKAKTLIQADTLHVQPSLSIVASRPSVAPGNSVRFFPNTNYARYIDVAELLIYRAEDSRDAAPHVRIPVKFGEPVLWIPALGEDGNYRFALRVYAKTGRYDETLVQSLRVSRTKEGSDTDERNGPLLTENQRIVSNIAVKGATVTVSGTDLPAGAKVELFGQNVPVSADGKFVAEQIVPEGMDKVSYTVKMPDGTQKQVERAVEVKKADHFLVAIADVTGGHRSWSNEAAVGELQGSEPDLRNNYLDGRLAFYYKGKLNDTYRITASADTGEHAIKDLFDQFGDKDPQSLLRRLDPDRHYPVYGDDSTTVEDAPSYGRFYVRAESQNSELMWGNFQTELTGNEFTQFSRGLYGGKVAWKSEGTTSFGERKTELTGFAADPGTIGSRDEFQSTGGTLYYLRRQDITQGSERVFVEVRDRDSGIVLERKELAPARDFDVNYLQGRLLLRQPVGITADAGQYVRNSSFAGNPVFIVTTYEYSPGLTSPATFTTGGQATQWLGNHVRIGGSAYHQGEDQAKQDLYGTDILLRYKPGTYIKGELAQSKGIGNATDVSSSGGYEFNSVQAAGGKATAFGLEAAADLSEISSGRGQLRGYWRKKDAGFSGPGALTGGQDIDQKGAAVDVALGVHTTLAGKADFTDSALADSHALEAGVTHDFTNGLFAKVGVRSDDRGGSIVTASPTLNQTGSRTDGAVTFGYRSNGHVPQRGTPASLFDVEAEKRAGLDPSVPESGDSKRSRPWSLYGLAQTTIDRSGTRQDNDRYGIGGDVQLDQRTRIKGEVTDGDNGTGVDIGADYAFSERGSLHLGYALAGENPDAYTTGSLGRITATTNYRFSKAVSVFAEGRYDHGTGPTGLTQGYGVDFAPSQSWRFGLRYDLGNLSDPFSGDIKRHAFGASVDYTNPQWRWSSAMEYRSDDSTQLGNRSTWATRNSITFTPENKDWRLYGKVNLAFSNGQKSDLLNANYYEVVTAAAYRPISNDRLNLLAKYTFLYDLPTAGQVSSNGRSIDFAQRSHVFAIDGTYQINRWLALGGKYALKIGELRPSRDPGAQWFKSNTQFAAVRADVRVIKEWDAVAEIRRLSVSEAHDSRVGALLGVYRNLGENLKIGVGYNFTDFSDNLTDLSYNENGVFFNIIAKF